MGIEDEFEQDENHEITCDNERCIVYSDNPFCYKGRERECALYLSWEKKTMGGKNA